MDVCSLRERSEPGPNGTPGELGDARRESEH